MDGNKDEGLRCMKIGKAAMESGDKVRAVKFLNMAKRMYPNPQVDSLLREMAEGEYEPSADKNSDRDSGRAGSTNGGGEGGEEVEETSHGRANGVHRSRSSTFGGAAEANANGNGNNKMPRSRSTPSVSEATPEQIEVVRRIRRTKDYYEILGLVKTCSEGEVRKAYRKISLKVHPDKNSAPGAEEAFKAVSKAFQVSHTKIRACLLPLYNQLESLVVVMMIVIIVDADASGEYQMVVWWWWWWVSPYRYATIYHFLQSRSCVCMMII